MADPRETHDDTTDTSGTSTRDASTDDTSAAGTSGDAPTREEIAGALGVPIDDPKVTEALGAQRSEQMMRDVMRQQQEAAASERAAAADKAQQAAQQRAADNQYTVEYDDPFTGEHVVEVREHGKEYSTIENQLEAERARMVQEEIAKGNTREKLETEGYGTTNTVEIEGKVYTSSTIARPDGRIENTQTVVDADGDGTRTIVVKDGLAGDGVSVVRQELDDGEVVDTTVVRERPGADGSVPRPGPNLAPTPAVVTVTQEDADAFVDALRPDGPQSPEGRQVLAETAAKFGLDVPGVDLPAAGSSATAGLAVPGLTLPGTTTQTALPGTGTTTATSGQAGSHPGNVHAGAGGNQGSTAAPGAGQNSPPQGDDRGAGSVADVRDDVGSSGTHAPGSPATGGAGNAGGGAPSPGAAQTAGSSLGSDIDTALANLSGGTPSAPSGVGADGSRGDAPTAGVGLGLGSLGTQNNGVGNSSPADTGAQGPKDGGSAGGPADTDGSGPAIPVMGKDGDGDGSDDGDDDDGDDGDGDGADDSDDTGTAMVDPDASGNSGFGDFEGTTTGDFMVRAGGSVVDTRFTNTGRPDTPGVEIDTSVPPSKPDQPGGETPQPDVIDIDVDGHVDVDRLPDVVTTVRPDLVEFTPTIDPSSIPPETNPQAMDVEEGLASFDAANLDGANLAVAASDDFAASRLDGAELGIDDQNDFSADLDQPDFQGPDTAGFDADGDGLSDGFGLP